MHILGIDEVGRGCWAGPLVAGAVILAAPIAGLRDSKQLTKLRRTFLAAEIKNHALAWSLGWVSAEEVDAMGLTDAVRLAYLRAISGISPRIDKIVIDGAYNFLSSDKRATAVVKADQTVPCVSAASIIAKVDRDAYMEEAARRYPDYGFERHVGYGTRAHQLSLESIGPCVLHRRSFRPVQKVVSLESL